MNDWVEAAKNMKDGHDKYKSIKGKIEKVEGAIEYIRKLQSFASNLIHHRAGSSSVLLKLSYGGMIRLAGLLPTPYLSHYLKFYQSGINLLSDLWKATDEAKLALHWSRGLHKSATAFEDAIDALVDKFSYAGAMVDRDGLPSNDLPAGLKGYPKFAAEFEESRKDVGNAIQNVDWSKPKKAMETVGFHLEYAAGLREDLLRRKQLLSRGVVYQARDIAAAYAHFASTFSKIESAGDKASKTMQRLTSSTNPAESFVGSATEQAMIWDVYDREIKTQVSGIKNDDIDKLVNGNWKGTRDYKRMKRAMQNMRSLSNDWSLWAAWAANGRLMQLV